LFFFILSPLPTRFFVVWLRLVVKIVSIAAMCTSCVRYGLATRLLISEDRRGSFNPFSIQEEEAGVLKFFSPVPHVREQRICVMGDGGEVVLFFFLFGPKAVVPLPWRRRLRVHFHFTVHFSAFSRPPPAVLRHGFLTLFFCGAHSLHGRRGWYSGSCLDRF